MDYVKVHIRLGDKIESYIKIKHYFFSLNLSVSSSSSHQMTWGWGLIIRYSKYKVIIEMSLQRLEIKLYIILSRIRYYSNTNDR